MIGYFDLETLNMHDEVGGWDFSRDMGFALGAMYVDEDRAYNLYIGNDPNREGSGCYEGVDDTEQLITDLSELELIVGFNIKKFDYAVLQPYATQHDVQLNALPTFDILEELGILVGKKYPASLESLASINLGKYGSKIEDGREIVSMYRRGMIDEVLLYCIHDVWSTRMLFQMAYESGQLQMRMHNGAYRTVDTTIWRETVYRMLKGRDITEW